ncbi:D-ribose pyranase [Kiloniella antarctica]|uniref:D-ribose pyranase n=1 Tax=Kiloniella antarctica TaxID=1550907 RepID=A0ABW5BID1_9PROT
MKRTKLLNSHLSALVAQLGHMDEVLIVDAGFPTPKGVNVIDLAVVPGLPCLVDVLQALRSELCIETAIRAEEAGIDFINDIKSVLDDWSAELEQPIAFTQTPHDDMKQRTKQAKAIIRTGETTPYANLILVSGVVF